MLTGVIKVVSAEARPPTLVFRFTVEHYEKFERHRRARGQICDKSFLITVCGI